MSGGGVERPAELSPAVLGLRPHLEAVLGAVTQTRDSGARQLGEHAAAVGALTLRGRRRPAQTLTLTLTLILTQTLTQTTQTQILTLTGSETDSDSNSDSDSRHATSTNYFHSNSILRPR